LKDQEIQPDFWQVDVPIHIIGGDSALITFKGIGYDRRAMGSTMPMLDQPNEFMRVPSLQKVPVPDQVGLPFYSAYDCEMKNYYICELTNLLSIFFM